MAFGRKPQQEDPPPAQIAVREPATQTPAQQQDNSAPLAIPDELLAQVEALVQRIPPKDDSSSWGILEKLLAADVWQDLNKPWEGTSGNLLAGRRLMITDVGSRPSELDAGPEVFLVVESTDMANGEKITWTTSAVAVLIQLATAYVRGWLPIVAEITAAKKPTRRGHVPYHLNVLDIKADR